jgi:hypothetical protein
VNLLVDFDPFCAVLVVPFAPRLGWCSGAHAALVENKQMNGGKRTKTPASNLIRLWHFTQAQTGVGGLDTRRPKDRAGLVFSALEGSKGPKTGARCFWGPAWPDRSDRETSPAPRVPEEGCIRAYEPLYLGRGDLAVAKTPKEMTIDRMSSHEPPEDMVFINHGDPMPPIWINLPNGERVDYLEIMKLPPEERDAWFANMEGSNPEDITS